MAVNQEQLPCSSSAISYIHEGRTLPVPAESEVAAAAAALALWVFKHVGRLGLSFFFFFKLLFMVAVAKTYSALAAGIWDHPLLPTS